MGSSSCEPITALGRGNTASAAVQPSSPLATLSLRLFSTPSSFFSAPQLLGEARAPASSIVAPRAATWRHGSARAPGGSAGKAELPELPDVTLPGTGNRSACSPPADASCCPCWSGARGGCAAGTARHGTALPRTSVPRQGGKLSPGSRASRSNFCAENGDTERYRWTPGLASGCATEERGRRCTAGTALGLHCCRTASSLGNRETTQQGHHLGKESNFLHA